MPDGTASASYCSLWEGASVTLSRACRGFEYDETLFQCWEVLGLDDEGSLMLLYGACCQVGCLL